MTVRLGEGAAKSSPLLGKAQPQMGAGGAVDPSAAPKHDSSEADPEAADAEKRAADLRSVLGEEPEGNLVDGIEDDVLYTLMRGFDRVSSAHRDDADRSKSTTSSARRATCRRISLTCA
jgi:hypothetical protein